MPNFDSLMQQLDAIELEPTQEEIAQLEQVLIRLEFTENAIQKAKQAGMETGNLDSQLLEARTKIQRIIRTYKK